MKFFLHYKLKMSLNFQLSEERKSWNQSINSNSFISSKIIKKMSKNISRRAKIHSRSSVSVLHNPESNSIHLPSIQAKINRHETALSSYRLIDYSMEKVKYKAEPQKYLSSKIDFFNSENQRKLDVSKKKILIDIGVVPSPPKNIPIKIRRRHELAPQVHSLVQKYFRFKEMREFEQENYLVVGSESKIYY